MTREIALTRGYVALVDDKDYERVAAHRWYAERQNQNGVRVFRRFEEGGRLRWLGLARFILDASPGEIIDHVNGNPLDNRRANLRACSHAENMRNRCRVAKNPSGFKGVFAKRVGRWMARIGVDGTDHYLGTFSDPAEAARAYDAAALRYHGEFARLNFPATPQEVAA